MTTWICDWHSELEGFVGTSSLGHFIRNTGNLGFCLASEMYIGGWGNLVGLNPQPVECEALSPVGTVRIGLNALTPCWSLKVIRCYGEAPTPTW